MIKEKEFDLGKGIHIFGLNSKAWSLPLRIEWFKTSPLLFEGLVGKVAIFELDFLCLYYRVEMWGFNSEKNL